MFMKHECMIHSVNDPLVNSDHSFNFCGKKREGWGGEDNPINAPQLSSIAWHFPLWVFIISHKFRQFPLSSIFIRLVLPTTIRSCSNSHHNHHHQLPIFSCNMKIHNFCFLTVFFPIVSKSAYTLIGYFSFRSTNFEKRAV